MVLKETIDRLAAFEPTPFPVISLYLNTQPEERGRDNFNAFVRREFKERAKKWRARTPERESFERDFERITSYLDEELRSSSNGVAIFACSAENDFFEAVQTDAPIEEHLLCVSYQPHVYSLARLIDQYPHYAALVANTHRARLFVFGAGEEVEQRSEERPNIKRTMLGGWSQARYQRHIDNYYLHNARDVVESLDHLVREEHVKWIVLAGDEQIIPILREQLPDHLAGRVIGALRLDVATPNQEVMQATLDMVRTRDAREDEEKVAELLDEHLGSGFAVIGARDTLMALTLGQAEEMLISASLGDLRDNLEGEDASLVPAVPGDTNGRMRLITIADELVARARQTEARTKFIEDAARLAQHGGVGAKLRARLSQDQPSA
jgi:peptide chain release factor subunit 1